MITEFFGGPLKFCTERWVYPLPHFNHDSVDITFRNPSRESGVSRLWFACNSATNNLRGSRSFLVPDLVPSHAVAKLEKYKLVTDAPLNWLLLSWLSYLTETPGKQFAEGFTRQEEERQNLLQMRGKTCNLKPGPPKDHKMKELCLVSM